MAEYQVYKIIREDDEDRLWSIWKQGHYVTEYFQGIYIKPEIGKLFAYEDKSLIDLELHTVGATPPYNYQVWECLTTGKPVPFHTLIPRLSWQEIWIEYWFGHPVWKFDSNQGMYTPKGTVLCEDIKLYKCLGKTN